METPVAQVIQVILVQSVEGTTKVACLYTLDGDLITRIEEELIHAPDDADAEEVAPLAVVEDQP